MKQDKALRNTKHLQKSLRRKKNLETNSSPQNPVMFYEVDFSQFQASNYHFPSRSTDYYWVPFELLAAVRLNGTLTRL